MRPVSADFMNEVSAPTVIQSIPGNPLPTPGKKVPDARIAHRTAKC